MTSPFLDRPESDWIAANELAFAIRDAYAVSPGHALVVPRRLIADWFDATEDERQAIIKLVDEVKRQLDAAKPRPDGYNIGINCGVAAGQTVMHLHVHVIRGEAVYCFRRFRDLIGDMAEGGWARFVRRLPRNRATMGDPQDLRDFLFGVDRSGLGVVGDLLREQGGDRCFYCDGRTRGEAAVDHFIPWARYPMDLGHNYVLTDARCNGHKSDRLAAV